MLREASQNDAVGGQERGTLPEDRLVNDFLDNWLCQDGQNQVESLVSLRWKTALSITKSRPKVTFRWL